MPQLKKALGLGSIVEVVVTGRVVKELFSAGEDVKSIIVNCIHDVLQSVSS